MRHGGCHCLPPSPAGQPASTMSPQLLHIIIFCAQRTHILPIYSWFCFIHLNCSFSCGSNANAPNICDSFFFFFQFHATFPFASSPSPMLRASAVDCRLFVRVFFTFSLYSFAFIIFPVLFAHFMYSQSAQYVTCILCFHFLLLFYTE